MKRFALPAPGKKQVSIDTVIVIEPCYFLDDSQSSPVLLSRMFTAIAIAGADRAGWSIDSLKLLNALQVEQLMARIANSKGKVRIYTYSVTLLLWTSPLCSVLAERGWRLEWLFAGGATEMLRISRGSGRSSVTIQTVSTVAPDYNANPASVPTRRARLSPDNHRSASTQFYARTEVLNMADSVRRWFSLAADHSSVPVQGSIGGQAWVDWRASQGAQSTCFVYPDADLRQYCRAAYFGGFVRAFRQGDFKGSYSVIDISSSYPNVMSKRLYPSELYAWQYDLDIDQAAEWLKRDCIIAEVELYTDEPIYPVREAGRIEYPTGTLRAHVASASLKYAITRGHLRRIHTAQLWRSGRPFKEWVKYWWGIRDYLKLNDEPEKAKLCKLLMNSLYGRLGMRVARPVIEEDARAQETRYEYGLVPVDALPDGIVTALPSGGHMELQGRQYVPYTDTTLLGRRTVAVEGTEPPLSVPHLSAHITDYARIDLWQKIRSLGMGNVFYADTDSCIIPTSKVPRSMRRQEAPKLGQWSVREEGEGLQVFGEKLYILHGHTTASGLPATAIPIAPHQWEAPQSQGLLEILSGEPEPGVKVDIQSFTLDKKRQLKELAKGVKLT